MKEDVDDTLNTCGAVFIGEKHHEACFPGLGGESVQAIFRLLLHGLTIDIQFKGKIELEDLDLAPDVIATI